MGDGEPAVTAVRGGRRLPRSPFPGSLRPPCGSPRQAGRGVPIVSTRPRHMPPASFASSVSRTPLVAKLVSDPGLRARPARTASSTGRSRSSRSPDRSKIEALKRARTQALRRAGRSSSRAPIWRRSRRLGPRSLARLGAAEPGAGGRRRCRSSRARDIRLRGPAHPRRRPSRSRSRRSRGCPRAQAHPGRRRARPRQRSRQLARDDSERGRPDRVPRGAPARGCARGRRRRRGSAADERVGELPALCRRGTRSRRAGCRDGRGWRARDRAGRDQRAPRAGR